MSKQMNIALMVRAYIPMPRPSDMIYAPIDLAVALAQGLGSHGHKVTIFAPIGTEVKGENITVETMNLRPLVRNQPDFASLLDNGNYLSHDVHGLWDRYMVNEMYRRAEKGEFDLLYFHHPESALSTAVDHPSVPTIYTLNDPIYDWYRELFELYESPNQKYISISNNQRRDAPDLPYLQTIYNGTDIRLFNFSKKHENYLLFVGRITSVKGVKEAIQVAKGSNHRLLIIGPVDHGSQGYFDQYIKPQLDDKILYLGGMGQRQMVKYYQKAKAVLTPVQWEEPFGLTTIEAMSCGTPVISLNRGAAPEIIINGKTGYVVNSIAEMIEAVGKINKIDRRDCHDHVAHKFSYAQMVKQYERAFQKVISENKPKPVIPRTPKEYIKQKIKEVRKRLPKITGEL
jgi:glycosyltransferase involved in cell wall biosynthesis